MSNSPKLRADIDVWERVHPVHRELLECYEVDEDGVEHKYLAEAEIYMCGAHTIFKEGPRVTETPPVARVRTMPTT